MKRIENLKRYIPFLCLFVIMLVFHAFMIEDPNRDAIRFFSHAFDEGSLGAFLKMRWNTWSSRVLIEAVLVFFALHVNMWRLADSLVWVLLTYGISKLLESEEDEHMNWMCVAAILIYPIGDMLGAGWVATTLNYSWPLTAGVFALIPIVRKKKFNPVTALLLLPLTAFACNMEQMAAVMFWILLVGTLWMFFAKHQCNFYLMEELLISIASMIAIMKCPGNHVRMLTEKPDGMLDFATKSALEKFFNGYSDTVLQGIKSSIVILVVTLMIFLLVVWKTNKSGYRILAGFPLLLALQPVISAFIPGISVQMLGAQTLSDTTYLERNAYAVLLMEIAFFACIWLTTLSLSDTWEETIMMSAIYAAAIGSRVMLGFSPTLTSSGSRTFLYMDYLLIYIVLFFYKKAREDDESTLSGGKGEKTVSMDQIFVMIWGMLAAIGGMNSLLYISGAR